MCALARHPNVAVKASGMPSLSAEPYPFRDLHGAIRQLVQQTGVALCGLGYYPNPLDPDPKVARVATDHLRRVIRAAASLCIAWIVTPESSNARIRFA